MSDASNRVLPVLSWRTPKLDLPRPAFLRHFNRAIAHIVCTVERPILADCHRGNSGLCMGVGGSFRFREKQTRQLQATALFIHGRLGHVVSAPDRKNKVFRIIWNEVDYQLFHLNLYLTWHGFHKSQISTLGKNFR